MFNQRQGISSHLGTILGTWNFPRVAVLLLIFISTWDGCLRESLSILQVSQATCTVCCGTRDSYAANQREMHFILCWFRLHWAILHSWVDIRVHLVLWQCSWILSGALSRKSRLLPCLIRNTICSARNAGKSSLISRRGVCVMGFLELQQEPGVYSRVMAGVAFKNFCLFIEIRTPV